jgi:hypothetical protein
MTASKNSRSDTESKTSAPTTPTGAQAATPAMSSGLAGTATPKPEASLDNDKQRRVAEAAYYRAERRGFVHGADQDDWFAAERELNGNTPSAKSD